MKKKIISILLISIFLMTTLIASVQSIDTTKLNATDFHTQLSTAPESHHIESTTIGTITTLIKDRLHQMPYSSRFKIRFTRYLEQGLYEMKRLGITSEKNLLEIQSILIEENRPAGLMKSRRFLMNVYPDSVEIETTIPPYIENRTGDNSTLEIFIKLNPFVDSIKTTQQIIIRKLYQETSLIWPAIGARIVEDNTTTFIIAFGPRIKWTWSLF